MRLVVHIPGRPVPKGRPRTVHTTRGPRTFTPKKTKLYERHVGLCGFQARQRWEVANRRKWPRDALYAVGITASFTGRRAADLDNVLKSIKDGLNGILWDDDSQVARYLDAPGKLLEQAETFARLVVEVQA